MFESVVHSRIRSHFENIYHKYRKHHGCDTAILSLTERLKQELDNLKVIGIVSRDLSKVFDTHPHNLIVMKSKQYQVDDKIIDLLKDYLFNRRQRVKLRNAHSIWQDTTTGIPQGSILTTNSYHMCSVQLGLKGVLVHLPRQEKTGSVIAIETVLAMSYWWARRRAKQLSLSATTRVIWLCACVLYWSYQGVGTRTSVPSLRCLSILSPVLFSIFMNNGRIYARDELSDKWFLENGMKRNHSQYRAMMMGYLTNGKRAACNHGVIGVMDAQERSVRVARGD